MLKKPLVTRSNWYAAHAALLEREKAFTRARDAIAQARLVSPMRKFPEDFFFDAGDELVPLAALFDGCSQLIIYHFLLPPGVGPDDPVWRTGVDGCAFVADHFDAANTHLRAHDVSLVAVSEAPIIEFAALRRRMGWQFTCYGGATRNFHGEVFSQNGEPEAHVPGISVYLRDGGRIYQTYSAVARGIDILIGTYNFLDIAPLGRNEDSPMDWMRFHDEY